MTYIWFVVRRVASRETCLKSLKLFLNQMQFLFFLPFIASVFATVDPCQADYDLLDACQADPTSGPLANDCIVSTGAPTIPKTCDAAAYAQNRADCVCPWLKANIPCALKYCPPFNLTCFKILINYTQYCGADVATVSEAPNQYGANSLLALASFFMALLML
jgi:hypothetical protein